MGTFPSDNRPYSFTCPQGWKLQTVRLSGTGKNRAGQAKKIFTFPKERRKFFKLLSICLSRTGKNRAGQVDFLDTCPKERLKYFVISTPGPTLFLLVPDRQTIYNFHPRLNEHIGYLKVIRPPQFFCILLTFSEFVGNVQLVRLCIYLLGCSSLNHCIVAVPITWTSVKCNK